MKTPLGGFAEGALGVVAHGGRCLLGGFEGDLGRDFSKGAMTGQIEVGLGRL